MTIRELYNVARAANVLDEQLYITVLKDDDITERYTPDDLLGVRRNESSESFNGYVELVLKS